MNFGSLNYIQTKNVNEKEFYLILGGRAEIWLSGPACAVHANLFRPW
jgi:hypothetical protein